MVKICCIAFFITGFLASLITSSYLQENGFDNVKEEREELEEWLGYVPDYCICCFVDLLIVSSMLFMLIQSACWYIRGMNRDKSE